MRHCEKIINNNLKMIEMERRDRYRQSTLEYIESDQDGSDSEKENEK